MTSLLSPETQAALVKHLHTQFAYAALDSRRNDQLTDEVAAALSDTGKLGGIGKEERATIIAKLGNLYLDEGELEACIQAYEPLGIFPENAINAKADELFAETTARSHERWYNRRNIEQALKYYTATDSAEGMLKVADRYFEWDDMRQGHELYAALGRTPPSWALTKEAQRMIGNAEAYIRTLHRHDARKLDLERFSDIVDYCAQWGLEKLLISVGDCLITHQPDKYQLGEEKYAQLIGIAKQCYTLSGNGHVAKAL